MLKDKAIINDLKRENKCVQWLTCNLKLSSYKLVQYLRNYINPKKIIISIEIKSHSAQNWFFCLGFKCKNMKKDLFINRYKQSDII